MLILQSVPSLLDHIPESASSQFTIWGIVGISLCTYLLGALVQYIVSILLKKADVSNSRKIKIAELSIAKENEIYRELVRLRGFQKNESKEMLSTIEQLNLDLSSGRLLLSNGFHSCADMIVEYFSVVCGDFTKKDVKKEKKLFEALYNSFYRG